MHLDAGEYRYMYGGAEKQVHITSFVHVGKAWKEARLPSCVVYLDDATG